MKACNAMLKLVKEKYPYLSAAFGVEKIDVLALSQKELKHEIPGFFFRKSRLVFKI